MMNAKYNAASISGVRKISATLSGSLNKCREREQREVCREKRQHQGQLIHSVGDEYTGRHHEQRCGFHRVCLSAPPALTRVKQVITNASRTRPG